MSIKGILKNLFIDQGYKDKLAFLRSVSLFSDLNKRSLSEILNISFEKSYYANETVFKEGDLGRALYIVISGEVAVSKNKKEICKFHQGDFFGEFALVEEVPRTATVIAVTNCRLMLIYKVKFDGILEKDNSIDVKMKEIINSRFNKPEQSA